jgi:ABC-type lipopolysaccharide export system ATPase subunit
VESFQSAVRDLLDYRQWFRFQLSYDQGEQIRHRELTDRAFFQFSGGEKAMAMYIPLFSAAYSRYLEAGADAPYLITLDEAFAGVDEENIRDMFRLVEQLHFNYIMNSQVLWGDYDVVPSLNVYELLRPRNAAYVTVVGSHWDGHVRKLMTGGADNDGQAAAD